MIDRLYRVVYRWGFRSAQVVWGVTRPSVRGALVAVRHGDRLLLVRNSYRSEWTMPGGGIASGEAALPAAVREIREEIGWLIEEASLRELGSVEFFVHNRNDHVTLFEMSCTERHSIRLDNREVIEARFVTKSEALELPLLPHVRHYVVTLWSE